MKTKISLSMLMIALGALPSFAAPSATNYVVTVVASTNATATTVIAVDESLARSKWWFSVRAACHYAFGRAATTNDPILDAGSAINDEIQPIWASTVTIRATNNAATKADVTIQYK